MVHDASWSCQYNETKLMGPEQVTIPLRALRLLGKMRITMQFAKHFHKRHIILIVWVKVDYPKGRHSYHWIYLIKPQNKLLSQAIPTTKPWLDKHQTHCKMLYIKRHWTITASQCDKSPCTNETRTPPQIESFLSPKQIQSRGARTGNQIIWIQCPCF